MDSVELDLIIQVIDLFAHSTRIPVSLYIVNPLEGLTMVYQSQESLFPDFCRNIWKLNRGEGNVICKENMCGRANNVLSTKRPNKGYCHAGLTGITEPLVNENHEIYAIIQYGSIKLDNQADEEAKSLQRKCLEVLKTQENNSRIINNLYESMPVRSLDDLNYIRSNLSPIISKIINHYLNQRKNEYRSQELAYHELQMQHQAALAHSENLFLALPEGSDYKEKAEDIVIAIERAGTVFHGLTLGRYLPREYRFRRRNLIDIIDQALLYCKTEAKRKGIRMDLEVTSVKTVIDVSEKHLQHAFNNIIQNAVKYSYYSTPKSSERFVSIRCADKAGGIETSITNYGVGIFSDEYDKIFQGDYKGRQTKAEYRDGAGKGLWLSREIIIEHNGSIVPESVPVVRNKWNDEIPYITTFRIWLPYRHDNEMRI
jgi:signal transduction histidine kinase